MRKKYKRYSFLLWVGSVPTKVVRPVLFYIKLTREEQGSTDSGFIVSKKIKKAAQKAAPIHYFSYFLKMIVALCPPNPSELLRAALTSSFLDSFGT